MRVPVVAGLIVAVHVAVIGSVVMTQGCATTSRQAESVAPASAEPAPPPVLPPSPPVVVAPPVTFPPLQPPAPPPPSPATVAAENVYVVRSGDSLSKIAARHGVNARELAELNQIADPNKIRAGQKLMLPDYSKPSQSPPGAKAEAAPVQAKAKAAAAGGTYEVRSGDSLSKIAKAHGVKMKDLMAANQIADANKIRAGQKLVIPGGSAASASAAAKPQAEKPAPAPVAVPAAEEPAVDELNVPAEAAVDAAPSDLEQEAMLDYTVQEGDTVEGIARLFVVRQDDIRRVNSLPLGEDVTPGQRIKIPPASL